MFLPNDNLGALKARSEVGASLSNSWGNLIVHPGTIGNHLPLNALPPIGRLDSDFSTLVPTPMIDL